MPATDSEPASMEDPHALEGEEGSSTNIPSSDPPAPLPSSTPSDPTTTRPNNLPSETMIEKKAVSMASNDCSSALSSPAEASPAKPAATSPTTFEGTAEASPATSHIASASDSLTCTGTRMVNISESELKFPLTTFGNRGQENLPSVLTFKGVSVTLENNSVWNQFYRCGTEMILTKPGRRMFPYCRYRLAGLDPERKYSLVLSIVPSDQYKYRWNATKWEINGPAEHQGQGLIRAFSHHYSPNQGAHWMGSLVSFYKLKLTNHPQDQDGHVILHSMHRYIPRLHVIPVLDGDAPTPDKPVVMGPESMTFTFPQTEFMAVTTYQNFRITQLKINHNPFAKGFREDGHNPRLNRVTTEAQPVVKTDYLHVIFKPAELNENEEKEIMDQSTENRTVPASLSNEQETRLVLKPIMSTSSTKDEPYVPCIRGKHALGELVLVQRPLEENKEETLAEITTTPTSSASSPGSSPGYRKRRRRINRRWANSRGSMWKPAAASPTVHHSPSSTVAMQPELDDVEGLLFVSFTSKEALEFHVGDKPASSTPSAFPVSPTTPILSKEIVEVIPETDEEKIAGLEAILLQDLRLVKHRQVIHPVLQEVGLKLSSLDQTKSIDLQYLGVHLPLPAPNLPEQGNATALSPGDKGLSFISRTGKTSDMTKIKGWKNKFIRSKETSPPNCDGSQKNLSAFCSNMLDEYLESEAQYISERADAFSTHSEGSVAYQLPAKSSSYVKTLDSVLKHRKAAAKSPVGANRPCPLSYKPLLYSALASPAPPLASPGTSETPVPAGAQPIQQAASPPPQPVAQRVPVFQPAVNHRAVGSFSQNHWLAHRPSGFTKFKQQMLQMEFGALNQGLRRTQLTQDRLSVALSGLLTKQMRASQMSKVAFSPKFKAARPECGQEFCTLGCICSSLRQTNRAPFHCRQPECMFGCGCFKRKITKQLSMLTNKDQPVYSMINMEQLIKPSLGAHAKKLWTSNINDVDPEPVLIPKSAPQCTAPVKVFKPYTAPRFTQLVREEDKDPVYRYFESLMTCARVREFNSKPPPELTIEPKIIDPPPPNTTAKPQKTTDDNLPKKYFRTVMAFKKTGENAQAQGTTSDEKDAKKQIEIQSGCQWANDRKMVLEVLCRRMNNNRLSERFWVGPYFIRPVAKIFMRKPSGSIVTYRVHISKPSVTSDSDEDESDDSDEESHANKSCDGDMDAQEDDGQNEESHTRFGVTPFLSGVVPAGRLKARTKPVGCQALGLIQVNGKSYNQARLLLGNMGSLHPTNRLAAFVTGRLRPPSSLKITTNKITTSGTPLMKPAVRAAPPIITAKKTTDLKLPIQPPDQLLKPDSLKKGSINLLQHPQNLFTVGPLASGQHSSFSPFQNSSISSPVSLTVSPSLKTPSFLGQSGTYSFRICPPANQGTKGQNMPGVTLPGGFTLIQLPTPGADGAASQSVNTTKTAGVVKAPPQKGALINVGHLTDSSNANRPGFDTLTAAKDPLSSKPVEPGSSAELTCDEKMQSVENETKGRHVDSNMDITSEDLTSDSDSSDYCGEGDEDEEMVDIETVEETRQAIAIAQMKEAVRKALKESGDSSDGFGSVRGLSTQDNMDDDQCEDKKRRKNHSVLERQRRSEQRILFDRLQKVLKSDPRAPRLHLLSLALKEIQNQVLTSRLLEEKKRRLTQMQTLYVKELSFLSGKSDTVIKNKLNEICERQKMREKGMKWRPFFSNLLQSRAAFLENSTTPQPKPPLQPNFSTAPSQDKPPTTSIQDKIMSMLTPSLLRAPAQFTVQTPTPQPVSTPAQVVVPAPSLQGCQHQTKIAGQQLILREIPKQIVFTPAQVSKPIPQTESPVTAPPPVTAAQDGASPASSNPSSSQPLVKPAQSLSLPLIRAKNGRIILPSSLRPLGHGFYTLMVMKPKDEVSSSAEKKPADVDSSTKQDKSLSENDHPLNSGSSQEDKTAQSSNCKPKRPGGTVPLAELALLNKSVFMPSVTLQDVKKSQEGSAALALNETAARLDFQRVKLVPAPVEPDPSPPVVPRRRGRPRKNPVTPVGADEKPAVVKGAGKSETSVPVGEKEKTTMKAMKTQAVDSPGAVSDGPTPAKRGRGRPPKKKKKTASLWKPPVMRGGSSPSKSNDNSPDRSSDSFKSPGNASRPLTRGALGKDFPSAKKRSWIDVEKELEPDLGPESEAEAEAEAEAEYE